LCKTLLLPDWTSQHVVVVVAQSVDSRTTPLHVVFFALMMNSGDLKQPLTDQQHEYYLSDSVGSSSPSATNPLFTAPNHGSIDMVGSNSISSVDSNWVRDLASEYQYCLVFPAENGDFTKRGVGYLETLRKLGFELFIYKNINPQKEIFVLLRIPLEKLRAFADARDYIMLLDANEVEDQLSAGDPEHNIEPVHISHMPDVTRYRPYEKIFGKYSRLIDEKLYYREPNMAHPFREVVALKLAALLIETRPGQSENLKIRRYLRSKWLLACFPLHNRSKTEDLEKKWSLYPSQKLPLHDLKEYFGEKIGLYFAFMEHYTTFLLIPAVSLKNLIFTCVTIV
jgi:hypothetical protein